MNVTIYFSKKEKQVWKEFKKIAKQKEVSMSELIKIYIKNYVKRNGGENESRLSV